MRDGHAVQISWPLTVNCWSGASFSTRTGRRRNSGSGPCRSTDRVRPALAQPVGLRPDTAMRADVWWRPTGRCSSTLTRALTRREAVSYAIRASLGGAASLGPLSAPDSSAGGSGEWPRNSLGCPSQPLKAPCESQELFLFVGRCPTQRHGNPGGNDNETPRALLDADYLPTVWEDRQGRLDRKPNAACWEAGLVRLSHRIWCRQGREPDGVL